MRTLLYLCLFLFLSLSHNLPLYAQQITWEDFMQMAMDEEQNDRTDWAAHIEWLSQLHDHPLNINTATAEELLQIPILDKEQVMEIHTYIFLHRGMHTLSELMAIRSLDARTRDLLGLFLYAGPWKGNTTDRQKLNTLLKNSKHEIQTRIELPLYYRKGYTIAPNQGGYLGQPISTNLRYRIQSLSHLDIAFKAQQDAGEPFRHNNGFDFYSGYIALKNIKKINSIVLGDYQIGFAQGLVINKSYGFGKTSFERNTQGLRPHTGMDETNYLRGLAVQLKLKKTTMTIWASARQADASLDSSGAVRTIQTSGLHRTIKELKRKHNLLSTHLGAHLEWETRKALSLGGTVYAEMLNRSLSPGTQRYRTFYPQGKRFLILGVNYAYHLHWLDIRGETALSNNNIATLNKISYRPSINTKLTLSQRYYAKAYHSLHASALSENGSVQNENGAMIQVETKLWNKTNLASYLDLFYNPWPQYGMTHSNSGMEAMCMFTQSIKENGKLSLRYQYKNKERYDKRQQHHRLRLRYTLQANENWRLESTINTHFIQKEQGWAISQSIKHNSSNQKWREQLQATWFSTTSYNSNIYAYEPQILGRFQNNMLYGKGLRLTMLCTRQWYKQKLRVELKYSMQYCRDNNRQTKGLEEIHAPWRNDLSIQLRLKL